MASQAFVVDTGENNSVSLPQGEATELSFNTSEVAGMKLSDSGELTISFRDGGSLTINNFRELAEAMYKLLWKTAIQSIQKPCSILLQQT